ncbi:TonB C-terminal domain-containing protein [bacterium]|nr:TonB C-terminal domain-containing protein [bacterium]MDC1221351.1 TonB C-terminal domain-containing protein [Salibacteraceae bacterium]
MKAPDDNKKKGIIATIVFHAALLIIFLFTGLTMPNPLPDEIGMEIEMDFGNTDLGSGEEQPQSSEPQEITEPVSEPVETNPVDAVEEVATQNTESAIAAPKEVKEEKVEETKPELDKRLKEAIANPFATNEDNDSKGQGNSSEAGDHGRAEGTPTGGSLSGGSGTGASLKGFGGRGFRNKPRVKGNWQESGVIVVEVIFDKYGKYVRATSGVRGTTINNAAMIKAVEEAVRSATIDPDPDGPAEKKGEIKFVFTLE